MEGDGSASVGEMDGGGGAMEWMVEEKAALEVEHLKEEILG